MLCLDPYIQPVQGQTRDALARLIEEQNWEIGDYTYGVPDVVEPGCAKLTIGRYCSIASGVSIIMGNHQSGWVTTYPFVSLPDHWPLPGGLSDHTSRGAVTIGHDVWIGLKATILSGVTIGDGAIIATGAVVSRDVPAYHIAGGMPAKVIKPRFDPQTIARLHALRWWDWPRDRVERMLPLMLSLDVGRFLDAAETENGTAPRPLPPRRGWWKLFGHPNPVWEAGRRHPLRGGTAGT